MRILRFPANFKRQYKSKSANVDEIIPITFSETDVERMLTQIAERMVKKGRTVGPWSAAKKPDLYDVDQRILDLQKNPKIVGFTGRKGRELLRGWLLATVVTTISQGKSRIGEKLDYVAPVSAAAYRTGLPRDRQRHRRADEVVYHAMARELISRGEPNFQNVLSDLCKKTIGVGVDFGATAGEPSYDNATPLDINTVFALRFIESFPQSQLEAKPKDIQLQKPAVFGSVAPMGRDLVSIFQIAAVEKWQAGDVYKSLSAVLALRLLQLPLRNAIALREVFSGNTNGDMLPSQMSIDEVTSSSFWKNPLEIYCDFTEQAGSTSDQLAKQCVARDLDVLRGFFRDRMLYKALLMVSSTTHREQVANMEPHQVLSFLSSNRNAQEIDLASSLLLSQLLDAYVPDSESDEIDDLESYQTVESIISSNRTGIEKLSEVLTIGNERDGVEGQIKWFRTVSGLGSQSSNKSTHLVQGTFGARQTWKYALSESMLVAIVDLCFVEDHELEGTSAPFVTSRISAEKLIERLRTRFGILIAEPPKEFDSPEAREAAALNLEAFLGVLRQLGCFLGLSDDFNAQYITRPRNSSGTGGMS